MIVLYITVPIHNFALFHSDTVSAVGETFSAHFLSTYSRVKIWEENW